MAKGSDKNTFIDAINSRLASPKQERVHFASRVLQQGAKDTGARKVPIFPEGKAKFKVARPAVPAPTELGDQLNSGVLPNRGAYFDAYLQNIPGGAEKFVAEQRANYERDDPDNLKRSPYSLSYSHPDPLIDFEKRKKPILISSNTDKALTDVEAYYSPATDSVAGVSLKNVYFDNLSDEAIDKTEYAKKVDTTKKELSSPLDLSAYTGAGESIDSNQGRNTLFHELAHSYTSAAERHPQIYELGKKGEIQGNLLKKQGTYNTSTNAEYAQSVVTGLNSMRSITGEKLNDPQSIHQLFDEIEKNPQILNEVSEEGGRLFRSYFHLKKNNPWAAEKLREATARDSKYLAKNDTSAFLKSLRGRLS
jgi:hypothetical protein